MPMRGELPPIQVRSSVRETAIDSAWSRVCAVIANQELQFISSICIIGCLIGLNFILRFPDFGATAAAYPFFP